MAEKNITPEEVELTSGPPISFKEHLKVFGVPEVALEMMKKRCEACHDWVCAAYMDQIEHYIKRLMLEPSRGVREPTMVMLYEVDPDVAEMIDDAWDEIEREYGIEPYEEEGYIFYRLKGMREERARAILNRKARELIEKFEDMMLDRLGHEKYTNVQSIRREVRSIAAKRKPKRKVRPAVEVPEVVPERREKSLEEELKEIESMMERLKRIREEIKKEIEKRG